MKLHANNDLTRISFSDLHVNCNGPEGGYATTSTSFEIKDGTVLHKWVFSSENGEDPDEFDIDPDAFDNIKTKVDALIFLQQRTLALKTEMEIIEKLKKTISASDFVNESASDTDDGGYE